MTQSGNRGETISRPFEAVRQPCRECFGVAKLVSRSSDADQGLLLQKQKIRIVGQPPSGGLQGKKVPVTFLQNRKK